MCVTYWHFRRAIQWRNPNPVYRHFITCRSNSISCQVVSQPAWENSLQGWSSGQTFYIGARFIVKYGTVKEIVNHFKHHHSNKWFTFSVPLMACSLNNYFSHQPWNRCPNEGLFNVDRMKHDYLHRGHALTNCNTSILAKTLYAPLYH